VTAENRGKYVYLLNTPNVLIAARAHFDCDSLDGVELEFSGSPEIPGSLWEKRIMNTDIMTSSYNGEPPVLSLITINALIDTGFYTLSATRTKNLMTWGKNSGCSFITKPCIENCAPITDDFCAEFTMHSRCTNDLINKGVCSMSTYNFPLPP
jgi:hypothetical protein